MYTHGHDLFLVFVLQEQCELNCSAYLNAREVQVIGDALGVWGVMK